MDAFTSFGVEGGAGIGAWFFFFGTLALWRDPDSAENYEHVLATWVAGSVFFTVGGIFLIIRHFIMDLA